MTNVNDNRRSIEHDICHDDDSDVIMLARSGAESASWCNQATSELEIIVRSQDVHVDDEKYLDDDEDYDTDFTIRTVMFDDYDGGECSCGNITDSHGMSVHLGSFMDEEDIAKLIALGMLIASGKRDLSDIDYVVRMIRCGNCGSFFYSKEEAIEWIE